MRNVCFRYSVDSVIDHVCDFGGPRKLPSLYRRWQLPADSQEDPAVYRNARHTRSKRVVFKPKI